MTSCAVAGGTRCGMQPRPLGQAGCTLCCVMRLAGCGLTACKAARSISGLSVLLLTSTLLCLAYAVLIAVLDIDQNTKV